MNQTPTQAGLQDISVMRSIPNIKVVQPSTEIETKKILQKYLNSKSKEIVYIRISREKTREFFLIKIINLKKET